MIFTAFGGDSHITPGFTLPSAEPGVRHRRDMNSYELDTSVPTLFPSMAPTFPVFKVSLPEQPGAQRNS